MLRIHEKKRRWLHHLRLWPRLIAVFSFRYDQHLVPGLIANLFPIVDGWVSFDDRYAKTGFSDESERRKALIAQAREIGADWILAMDPDERIEKRAAARIRVAICMTRRAAFTFRLRELYSPDQYRIDGIWGTKRRARLFPLLAGQVFSDAPLHGPWHPVEGGGKVRDLDINLYHLKMISKERRIARAALYRELDPEGRFQKIGYEYLADDTGLVLERIPPGREYWPPHREDGGLWMPDVRQSAGSAAPVSVDGLGSSAIRQRH